MIPIILHAPPAQEVPKIAAQENFSFQTTVLENGKWVPLNKSKKILSKVGIIAIGVNIRRHLRSNKYSITLDSDSMLPFKDYIEEVIINNVVFNKQELLKYKVKGKDSKYVFGPDNALKGEKANFSNFSSIILKTKRHSLGVKYKNSFRILMTSHKDVSNVDATTNNKPIEIKSVDSINILICGMAGNNNYYIKEVMGFNHLIFYPVKNKIRKFKKLYDVATYNDPLIIDYENNDNEVFGRLQSKYFETMIEDSDHSRDYDFHGGEVKNLLMNKGSKMTVAFSHVETPEVIYGNKKIGEISIFGMTHYDFDKKTTVLGPGEISSNGYIFPYSKKGVFIPKVVFSPNAAFKDFSISTKYFFGTKILDKYEGQIRLKITNPATTTLTKHKEFTFSEDDFEKIILNELSLKGLEGLNYE